MNLLKKYLFFLWNGGLHPERADLVELRERRTLSSTVLFLSPIGIALIVSNEVNGYGGDNVYLIIGLIAVISSLFIQAHLSLRIIAVNVYLFAFWMMPTAVMQSYGVQGTTMMWLIPHSAIAVLISGPRNGVVWAIICSITLAVYGYLHTHGLIPFDYGDHLYIPSAGIPNAMEIVFIIWISTGAAVLFRKRQRETEVKLNNLVGKLKAEITNRRRAEKNAKQSEQSKSAFLAAMSHEIRTPLNGVVAATRLLVDAKTDKEKNEFSDVILGSSETLLELIGDVMDLSAMESGQLNISAEVMSPREVVASSLKPFQFQAKEKGITLFMSIGQEVPEYIYADKTRAKQIVINLVGNAIKFTKQGEIRVRVYLELDKIVLEVKDTGIGISKEEQDKLFEPFVQASASTRQIFGGSGLGLTIVKKIVNAVQGDIVLESEPGKGSKFSIYIPYIKPSDESIKALKLRGLEKTDLQPLRLLIADDNAVNRMVLARLLENDNHKVVAVNDGQEALDFVKAHNVDAVLMDIQMPIMNGEEAAQEIRKLPVPKAAIPIIAITANASADDAKRLLSTNFNGFLSKPFRRESLVEVLQLTELSTSGNLESV